MFVYLVVRDYILNSVEKNPFQTLVPSTVSRGQDFNRY